MTAKRNDFDPQIYNPQFQWVFLSPKYWGTWLGLLVGVVISLLPHAVRKAIANFLAHFIVKVKGGSVKRARINLQLCFPEKSVAEREEILKKQFTVAICYLLNFPSVTLRSKNWLARNVELIGGKHLLQDTSQNTILLVPHTWCIDIPAIYLASTGLPVTGFVKTQSNALSDWLMHKQRVQYGGKIYERNQGIKPYIKAIRDGYLGYYLPDEDLGEKNSVFVDFFGTQKATMAGLDKFVRLGKARIVPLFSVINMETGKFEIHIAPEVTLTGDETKDARTLNAYIENCVGNQPEQYMWILKLLKTQPPGIEEPYVSDQYKF